MRKITTILFVLASLQVFAQADSTSSDYMLLTNGSTIELSGNFFNGEMVAYEVKEGGKVETIARRKVLYVKHSSAVYMSLPLVKNGWSKLTQVWAYSDKYLLTSVPSEVDPDVAYLNIYDMNFDLLETRMKIEAKGNSTKKNQKIVAANKVVIEKINSYFENETLLEDLNSNLDNMIRLTPVEVSPIQCCEGCDLPLEALKKADLKR